MKTEQILEKLEEVERLDEKDAATTSTLAIITKGN